MAMHPVDGLTVPPVRTRSTLIGFRRRRRRQGIVRPTRSGQPFALVSALVTTIGYQHRDVHERPALGILLRRRGSTNGVHRSTGSDASPLACGNVDDPVDSRSRWWITSLRRSGRFVALSGPGRERDRRPVIRSLHCRSIDGRLAWRGPGLHQRMGTARQREVRSAPGNPP